MAAHARLKNEITEDEKNFISWAGSYVFSEGILMSTTTYVFMKN